MTDVHAAGTDTAAASFGPHVVALIDFLGQARELAKWDFLPTTVGETATWLPAVRNTIGRVMLWREEFDKRFAEYQKSLDAYAQRFSAGAPAEKLRQFEQFRETMLGHAHFSDTLIFYSPLQNQHGYWQVSNVAGFLVVCGTLFLGALATKTVLRAAIEVGVLTHFPPDSTGRPGDPYGPGLAKAHYLESKVAQYPRIVVGPTLLSYLEAVEKDGGQDAPASANRAVAAQCRAHIAHDSDGCWIVDYLNDTFASAGVNPAGWRQLQADAFAFVQSELARFRSAGDDQLEKRYQRLHAYFCSRGGRAGSSAPTWQADA